MPDDHPEPMLNIFFYMQLFGLSYCQALQDPPDVRNKLMEIENVRRKVEDEERRKEERRQKNRTK